MQKLNSVLVPTGKFVTVTFVTNAGETRKINGRIGVRKYLTGKGKPMTESNRSKYFLVYTRSGSQLFDSPKMINKSNIKAIKAQGLTVETNKFSDYAKNV